MVDQLGKRELLEAIELFYFAYRSFTAGPDKVLQSQDLGRVHHRILYFVARNPGLNINELLRILDVSKQALNGPLRRLQELELVQAEADEQDRRVKRLRLSKAGEALERRLTRIQMKQLEGVFRDAGGEAVAGWRRIMRDVPERR